MKEQQRVSGSIEIAAAPEAVFALVTDLPRMGEWSPENRGGAWKGTADAAAVRARFVGTNQNGKKKWKGGVVVTEVTAPTRFAFRTVAGPMTFAEWIYEIAPTAGGCAVTETWVDTRNPVMARFLGKPITGVKDRAAWTRESIETTLANLRKAAEGGGAS